MALATLEDIRDAVEQRASTFMAPGTVSVGAQGVYSFWTVGRTPGGVGVAPVAAGANPTRSTAGAIPVRNAAGANELRLVGLDVWIPSLNDLRGLLVIYDRLWACGGLDGTSTSLETFTSAITRGDTTGAGVLLLLEIYTAIGNTSATATISYTNQAGTSGRTATVTIASTNVAARQCYLVQLQAGDTGVRSVESIQLSGSTGTVGSYGLTLVRPLSILPFLPVTSDRDQPVFDLFGLAFPAVDDDACIALLSFRPVSGSFSVNQFGLELEFREG